MAKSGKRLNLLFLALLTLGDFRVGCGIPNGEGREGGGRGDHQGRPICVWGDHHD